MKHSDLSKPKTSFIFGCPLSERFDKLYEMISQLVAAKESGIDIENLLTTQQAATLLLKDRRTVNRWRSQRKIVPVIVLPDNSARYSYEAVAAAYELEWGVKLVLPIDGPEPRSGQSGSKG